MHFKVELWTGKFDRDGNLIGDDGYLDYHFDDLEPALALAKAFTMCDEAYQAFIYPAHPKTNEYIPIDIDSATVVLPLYEWSRV